MKRHVVIGFVAAILSLGLVSSAHPARKMLFGLKLEVAKFAMDDVNDEIADVNDWIDAVKEDAEAAGWTLTPNYLPEMESGTGIEGYVGMDIGGHLELRLIGGFLSGQISGGWFATDGVDEETLTMTEEASCYFAGLEPILRFDLGKIDLLVGGGLAYYSATFNSSYLLESTDLPRESGSLKTRGNKIGYHGFVEGEFSLGDRTSVGVSIGYRRTGKITVKGDSAEGNLDFTGVFYSADLVFLV